MSRVFVQGYGVVSAAGWGMSGFREVIDGTRQLVPAEFIRPDGARLKALRTPAPAQRPVWLQNPRLRRSSAISHHTVAASLEALGSDGRVVEKPGLGIILSVMSGSVVYSRRFFAEALADPSTASPMLFPETVFNAPASHLGSVLATGARNDTCVADQTGFIAAMATATDWLDRGEVDSCLVVAAEEADWTTAEASRVFSKNIVPADGAAAVLLSREPAPVELVSISSPHPYVHGRRLAAAVDVIRTELGISNDSPFFTHGIDPANHEGQVALDTRLGDGFAATGGWTCIAAIDALSRNQCKTASACVGGSNLQVLGARFARVS